MRISVILLVFLCKVVANLLAAIVGCCVSFGIYRGEINREMGRENSDLREKRELYLREKERKRD